MPHHKREDAPLTNNQKASVKGTLKWKTQEVADSDDFGLNSDPALYKFCTNFLQQETFA
jgi:hypothetical protein